MTSSPSRGYTGRTSLSLAERNRRQSREERGPNLWKSAILAWVRKPEHRDGMRETSGGVEIRSYTGRVGHVQLKAVANQHHARLSWRERPQQHGALLRGRGIEHDHGSEGMSGCHAAACGLEPLLARVRRHRRGRRSDIVERIDRLGPEAQTGIGGLDRGQGTVRYLRSIVAQQPVTRCLEAGPQCRLPEPGFADQTDRGSLNDDDRAVEHKRPSPREDTGQNVIKQEVPKGRVVDRR